MPKSSGRNVHRPLRTTCYLLLEEQTPQVGESFEPHPSSSPVEVAAFQLHCLKGVLHLGSVVAAELISVTGSAEDEEYG